MKRQQMESKRMMIVKLHQIHQLHVRVSINKRYTVSRNVHAFRLLPFYMFSLYLYHHNITLPCEIFHGFRCAACYKIIFQLFTFFLFSWLGLSTCTNNITIFWTIHGIHLACEHFSWYCGHDRPITKCNPYP